MSRSVLLLALLQAIPVFAASPVAVLAGARQLGGHARIVARVLGLMTIAVALVFMAWVGGSVYGGLLERLILWPTILWAAFLGIRAMRAAVSPAPAVEKAETVTRDR